MHVFRFVLAALLLYGLTTTHPAAAKQVLTLPAVNQATFSEKTEKGPSATVLKAQVLLDRKRFSPGVIDAHIGENTEKAIRAFQRDRGLDETGKLDRSTWDALAAGDEEPVLIEYEISDDDVAGPFTKKIPAKLEAQAKLRRLGYRNPRELLAEKFHMDEDLLQSLNGKQSFDRAGARIVVANVNRPTESKSEVASIIVNKEEGSLRALSKDGTLIAFFPATVGSEENPAPSGTHKVTRIAKNPTYHYRPSLNFKGVKTNRPFTVPRGPNNPVGVVWINLDKPGYGIHGTPEPAEVSKTASHGCVRLTNWDVSMLAAMTRRGTPVQFEN